MKKAVSVFLLLMMICSAFSLRIAAEGDSTEISAVSAAAQTRQHLIETGRMSERDCTFVFFIGQGSYFYYEYVFDAASDSFVYASPDELSKQEAYVRFPAMRGSQEPGNDVPLPNVIGRDGMEFAGWRCEDEHAVYATDNRDCQISESWAGRILVFHAVYRTSGDQCVYCGEVHKGFFGFFVDRFHRFLAIRNKILPVLRAMFPF